MTSQPNWRWEESLLILNCRLCVQKPATKGLKQAQITRLVFMIQLPPPSPSVYCFGKFSPSPRFTYVCKDLNWLCITKEKKVGRAFSNDLHRGCWRYNNNKCYCCTTRWTRWSIHTLWSIVVQCHTQAIHTAYILQSVCMITSDLTMEDIVIPPAHLIGSSFDPLWKHPILKFLVIYHFYYNKI